MHATAIDVSPVTNALLELAATLLVAVGTWLIGRLVQWLGLKNAALATANLDDALQKSVTYGLQQTQGLIRQHGWDSVDVRNACLAKALPYMIQRFPGALKAVGVDASDEPALQNTVAAALDRAFPAAVAAAAASPATPPSVATAAPQPQPVARLVEVASA